MRQVKIRKKSKIDPPYCTILILNTETFYWGIKKTTGGILNMLCIFISTHFIERNAFMTVTQSNHILITVVNFNWVSYSSLCHP